MLIAARFGNSHTVSCYQNRKIAAIPLEFSHYQNHKLTFRGSSVQKCRISKTAGCSCAFPLPSSVFPSLPQIIHFFDPHPLNVGCSNEDRYTMVKPQSLLELSKFMNNQAEKKWQDPNRLIDIVQAVIALIAAIALALDSTGILEPPWIKTNLLELTFVAVLLLITMSTVERFTIRSFEEKMEGRLSGIEKQSKLLTNSLSGVVSADIVFGDRADYTALELRLKDAKEVWFSGQTLKGVVATYYTFFRELIKDGCEFRFLLEDPSHCTEKDEKEVRQTIEDLVSIKKTYPSQIEIRLTAEVLHYSLLLVDSKSQPGWIQVEFYAHHISTSARPHITLFPARDLKWYPFYQKQFEGLWNNATLHNAQPQPKS